MTRAEPGRPAAVRAARCELCGTEFEAAAELRYPRRGPGSPELPRGLRTCVECGRRACPACVQVVEERADDFFFDAFVCRECVADRP